MPGPSNTSRGSGSSGGKGGSTTSGGKSSSSGTTGSGGSRSSSGVGGQASGGGKIAWSSLTQEQRDSHARDCDDLGPPTADQNPYDYNR